MSSRSKTKKKKVSVSIRLHPEILKVIDKYADQLGVTRTDVIGVSIRAMFAHFTKSEVQKTK